jgi:hypothetical protein
VTGFGGVLEAEQSFSDMNSVRFIDSFASRSAMGLFDASSVASARAAGMSSSAGTTCSTAPSRYISSAETSSPVKNILRAL